MVRRTKRNNKKLNKLKLRCSVEKCNKKGKDIIFGEVYCRIHSPMREGFAKKLKEEEKKKK